MESVSRFLRSHFAGHDHSTRALLVVCLFSFLIGCAFQGQLTQQGGPGKQVRFMYEDYQASEVSIAADFTQWKPRPMRKDGKGRWSVVVPLTSGRYLYTFIVNGHIWQPDPAALLVEDDGFGKRNSVLVVE